MDKETVNEIIACLPRERTIYSYFAGRYALQLLARATLHTRSIRQLRRGPFAPLLQKPVVQQLLPDCGNGLVDPGVFDVWPEKSVHDFLLGLTAWGHARDRRYNQTSRRGHNLVLQLNFNTSHMARFARLVSHPSDYNCWLHPSCRESATRYRETLAWARLDVSFDTNEVLIEEIQSDFVRYVDWLRYAQDDPAAVRLFCAPFKQLWAEAMLSAAIGFVWNELGISQIYYHEFDTGNRLKGLKTNHPPRSLYSQLPRRFCMQLTTQAPEFLLKQNAARKTLSRMSDAKFYRLTDQGEHHAATTP